MAKNISFLQYMKAHGNTPGPTQRPLLTGAIGGLIAEMPSAALLYWSGALVGVAERAGSSLVTSHLVHAALMVLAGMLYAAIFKRAANDRTGGWLFGAAFGFGLWMFAPITIWQLFASRPLAVGKAAIGLFLGHVLYGLILGFLYPHIHGLVQGRLRRTSAETPASTNGPERAVIHHPKPEFVSQTAKIQTGKR